jgi:hypothetical protein
LLCPKLPQDNGPILSPKPEEFECPSVFLIPPLPPRSRTAQQSRIQSEAIDDPLSELAREGARRMLALVLIADLMHERRDIAAFRARTNSVWAHSKNETPKKAR